MANINKSFESLQNLFQREFDPNETLAVLKNPIQVYYSWGVERLLTIDNKSLLMLVNGHHHNGKWVLITLAWDDTYSYYLLNDNRTIKKETHGVYFDELQHRIDIDIEYISDYDNK